MEAAEREGIRNRNQPANYRSCPDQGHFHDCSYIINHDADCTSFDPKGAAFSERRLRKVRGRGGTDGTHGTYATYGTRAIEGSFISPGFVLLDAC